MSSQLTRRTQLLLDDELHHRLHEAAAQRGVSMGALIREAIEEKLSHVQAGRTEAFAKLLAADPMPVDDWPVMKKQMLEDRYAKIEKVADEALGPVDASGEPAQG
jgi:Ribbon-helix-helix protein, copG family